MCLPLLAHWTTAGPNNMFFQIILNSPKHIRKSPDYNRMIPWLGTGESLLHLNSFSFLPSFLPLCLSQTSNPYFSLAYFLFLPLFPPSLIPILSFPSLFIPSLPLPPSFLPSFPSLSFLSHTSNPYFSLPYFLSDRKSVV